MYRKLTGNFNKIRGLVNDEEESTWLSYNGSQKALNNGV